MKLEKICEICGKIFLSSAPNAKYCSDKCYQTNQKIKIYELKLLPKPMCKCLWCHKLFPERGQKKYCSPECGQFYSRKKRKVCKIFSSSKFEKEMGLLQELGDQYKFPDEDD